MVELAEKMIAGEVGAIEGARRIARLRSRLGDPDNDVLMPFVAIDSETDDVVVGDRALWEESFLAEIDREYEKYERSFQPMIAEDCRALLAVFAPRLRFWSILTRCGSM